MTLPIIIAVAWGVLTAGIGGLLTELSPWYYALKTPRWQPPNWLFGPAWTVILAASSYALYLGWQGAPDDASRNWLVVAFVVNGLLNVGWSLLFFKWRRPDLALLEAAPLWLSILAMVLLLAPISAQAAWLVAPYLAWVSFANVLNLVLVLLNWPFEGAGPVRGRWQLADGSRLSKYLKNIRHTVWGRLQWT